MIWITRSSDLHSDNIITTTTTTTRFGTCLLLLALAVSSGIMQLRLE